MLERYHVFILMLKLNIYFTLGIVAMIVSANYYIQKADYDQHDQLNTLLSAVGAPEDRFYRIEAPKAFATSFILPSAIIAIVVAGIYYTLGWFGIRRGNYPLMWIFFVFMMVDMGAVVAALARVVPDGKYQLTRNGLITFFETKHAMVLDVDKTTKPMPRTVPVLD
ncbi:hypothetical protein HDU67_004569 [Dinochytrium kinnereticum]|nr:hypothetical protein HDU67_004569 [Dinochytrium kinnereticum]